jgi:hypothetical protein
LALGRNALHRILELALEGRGRWHPACSLHRQRSHGGLRRCTRSISTVANF